MRIDYLTACNNAAYIVWMALLFGCCAFALVFGAAMAVPAVNVAGNALYQRLEDPESCDAAALERAAKWLEEKDAR